MAQRRGLVAAAEAVRRKGRRGDSVLAHISPAEARVMDRMQGGPSINPDTGAREYFSLGSLGAGLLRSAGGVVGNIVGGPIGAAVGSAAATALTGGGIEESLTNGFLGGLGAYMGGTDMSSLGLGTSSLFGSLGGAPLRHVGGAGSGAANFSGGGMGSNIWNGLTSGSGLAALGLGTMLMAPQSKPKAPTSPTASSSSRSSGNDVKYDAHAFNRQPRALGRDPYTYGQTGGEAQMFDVVNPAPVFKAKGGRISGARWKSQGLGRYAEGGQTIMPRDYYELDRPAETYDRQGEHKFFSDQRFADMALGSMAGGDSSVGRPSTPTNAPVANQEYGGKGSGMSPPSPGDFSVNDPDRAVAQLDFAQPAADIAGALGVPGIGGAMGITGALSAMGVHGVLSDPDVSEYDEGARSAHQAAIDDAADKNAAKGITPADIAIGALMGALSPPGTDLAGMVGVGPSPGVGGAVGQSGVGGTVGSPTGTPGSGDIGTVGGTSEAGPGGGGNPGTGGGDMGGDMGGGSGGVTGGMGQPGSADGPGVWAKGGRIRRYAQGGGVRRMATGGLSEYLRSYGPFNGKAPQFGQNRFGSGSGSPPPSGSGGGVGSSSTSTPAAPVVTDPARGGGRFNGIGRTNPSPTSPGQHSDIGQGLGALGGIIGGPFGAMMSFGLGMSDKYSGVNDGADASQYSGPHMDAALNRKDLIDAAKEADAINDANDTSFGDGLLAGLVNMISPPGFSAITRSPVSIGGKNTGGASGMGGSMSGGFGGTAGMGGPSIGGGQSRSGVSVGGSAENNGGGMAGGFGGSMGGFGGGGGGRSGGTSAGGAPQGGRSGGPRGYAGGGRLRQNLDAIARYADGGQVERPALSSYGYGPARDFFQRGRNGQPQPAQPAPQQPATPAGLGGGLGRWAGRFDGSRMPAPVRDVFTQVFNRMGGEGQWQPGAIFGHLAQRANPQGWSALQGLREQVGRPGTPDPQQPLAGGGRPRGAVKGPGTGQSDEIPALLSDGEYVMDSESVSALGDGSNDAGAKKLDEMRQRLRQHKRGASPNTIPPKAKPPEQYVRGGGKKKGKEK